MRACIKTIIRDIKFKRIKIYYIDLDLYNYRIIAYTRVHGTWYMVHVHVHVDSYIQ